jgi:hypothetical protein
MGILRVGTVLRRDRGRSRQDAIVTQPPPALAPSPGEQGLATSDPARLAWSVSRSWELFSAVVDDLDLHAPTRAPGLLARDVVVPLGAWADNRPLADLLDDARRGVVGDHDQGALVEAVRAAHRHEADDDVRAAVRRQGLELTAYLRTTTADDTLRGAPVASMLGTLPLVTFLHASTYPVATSALDLERAGAVVPDELIDLGLLGLVDTIGALAARQGLTASIAAVTPSGVVAMGSRGGDWRTVTFPVPAGGPSGSAIDAFGPSVRGGARVLLDVTAGRADVPSTVGRRELAVHDVAGLLALAPLVEQVPGIPGRSALVAAVRATQALGAAWRLLPFTRQR